MSPARSPRSSRSGSASPSPPGSPRSASASIPGFGFGKTVEQNFELLARLREIVALGRPVLVGLSRKSSLGRILGDPEATTGPLSASLAAAVEAYERGATIFRVHDVREHVEALTVAAAVAMIVVELEGLEVFGRHGVSRRSGATARPSSTTSGSRSETPRSPTGSRTPSTTARLPTACARSPTGGSST